MLVSSVWGYASVMFAIRLGVLAPNKHRRGDASKLIEPWHDLWKLTLLGTRFRSLGQRLPSYNETLEHLLCDGESCQMK